MPSFQTKALVVTQIRGDNFRIIPKEKPLFDALSNVYQTDVWAVLDIKNGFLLQKRKSSFIGAHMPN